MPKIRTSYALSREALDLLERLAERFGLSRASVLEMLIRDRARAEGMTGKEQDGGNEEA